MSPQTVKARVKPTPEEIERSTAGYRRGMYDRRNQAVMVYVDEHQSCPWAGCPTRIVGLSFQFEQWDDTQTAERLRKEWWLGPGAIGRCPGCGRWVLFGFQFKRAVEDPSAFESAVLPDNWIDLVRVSPRPKPIELRVE